MVNVDTREAWQHRLNAASFYQLRLHKVNKIECKKYSRALLAFHHLRIFPVLLLKVHHVHPVPLVVKRRPWRDVLSLCRTKWDRIEIRLPLASPSVRFVVLQQRILERRARCDFIAPRVPE